MKKERELELIHYDLQAFDRFGLNDSTTHKIVNALWYLPEETRNFVVKNVYFAEGSHVLPRRWIKEQYVIVLTPQATIHTVLHELAHIILGHAKGQSRTHLSSEENKQQENEANRLATQWLNSKEKKRG